MTSFDLGLLTFRALAVYSMIRALEYFGKIFKLMPAIREAEILEGLVFAEIITPPLILLACSILLWRIAPTLANKMFTGSSVIEKSRIEFSDIKSLVFSAIGLLVLVEAVPDVVKIFFLILFAMSYNTFNREVIAERNMLIVLIVFNMVKITIGCFLFFGVKGVVRILNKLRRD